MAKHVLFIALLCDAALAQITVYPVTLAGKSTTGSNDGVGTAASFNTPGGVLWDSGLLYISDWANHNIRVINTSAKIATTLAGRATSGGANGVGTSATFNNPNGLALDSARNLFIADAANCVIRAITLSTALVSTFAGKGTSGYADGIGSNAIFNLPYGIALDNSAGVMYVADNGNSKVRKIVMSAATVSFVAGGAGTGNTDGVGSNALFKSPTGVALSGGILYVSDHSTTNYVRAINLATSVVTSLTFISGLNEPNGLAFNPLGTILYVCDSLNGVIKAVTIATQAVASFSASLNNPYGVVTDNSGRVYVTVWSGSIVQYLSQSPLWACTAGADMQGADLTSFSTVTSIAACQAFCEANPSCAAVAFSASLQKCFLKKITGWLLLPNSAIQACNYTGFIPPYTTVLPPSSSITPSVSSSVTGTLSGSRSGTASSTVTRTVSPTATATPTSSLTTTVTGTGSPTATATPTSSSSMTVTQTPTPTTSFTSSNTATLTNTGTGSPTATPSPTPTPSTTMTASQTLSPTATITASNTPTLTPTGTGSPTVSSSLTPSPTATASQTPTPSSTITGSQSPSPSLSQTSSASPTSSPTPTSSPPLFSCLSRGTGGCKTPTLVFSAPVFSSGVFFSSPATPFVSYPYISQPFNVSLPVPPSSGENVGITCSFLSALANEVYIEGGSVSSSRGASFRVFAGPSAKDAPLSRTYTLSCDVASTLKPGGGALPYYGSHTLLTSPVLLIPSHRPPSLAAILAESVGKSGKFRGLGGVFGGNWVLDGRNITNTTWASPTLFTAAPSALHALTTFRSSILSSGADAPQPPPLFVSTISGKTHLLLLSSPGTTFSFGGNVNVSLGGYPCTTNWVTPDATIVSVTTPSGMGDFGIAPLGLWGGGGEEPFFRLLQNYSRGAPGQPSTLPPLSYPALFPPLLPLGGMAPPLGDDNATITALYPLMGLSPPSLLAATAAASTFPSNTLGIRVVTACSDPTFAPPEDCVVVNGTLQPYLNASSLMGSCAWGSGDGCQPCPVGAMCPGGEVLIPTPGYWVPSLSSPISDFTACPQPAPTQRCPALGGGGGALQLASAYSNCGLGYRGRACAVCDSAYFTASDGTCIPCPGISATLGILLPFLYLTLGLLGLGCVLVVVLHCVLVRRWRRLGRGKCVGGGGEGGDPPPPPPTLSNSAASVGQLVLWLWVAAQSSASLFSQARSIAPRALFPLYGILAALQLQGVTVDPACFTSQPFLSFWVCMGATLLGMVGLLLCMVLATRFEAAVGWVGSVPKGGLLLSAICLTMAYGAIVSVFADVLTCTLPTPIPLYDYVMAVSDGRTLSSALGPGAPPLTALRAAASNPYLAGNSQLYAFMQATTIPVSLQASNPFQVCKEGPHYAAWWAAFAMTLVFTFGYPAMGWVSLHYSTAPAPSATRTPLSQSEGGQQEGVGARRHTFFRRAMAHLSFHLSDSTFRPQAQWLLYVGQGGLALVTGLVGLSRRYGAADVPYFTAGQAGIVVLSALLAFVTHRTRPFAPLHTWKHPISIALFGLTGITSAFNAILTNLPPGSGTTPSGSATRTALGSVPLVCALVLGVVVVASWLRSVMSKGIGLVEVVEPLAVAEGANAPKKAKGGQPGGGGKLLDNPLFASPPLPLSIIWHAVRYQDGDLAWKSSSPFSSPATVWELPPGAATACGWKHDPVSGTWMHESSGVTSRRPPPRVFHGLVNNDSAATAAGGGVGFWHCYETQESLFTLPGAPCETACGWVAMGGKKGGGGKWRHIPTGEVRSDPPPPPRPLHIPTQFGSGVEYDFEPPGPLWRRHMDESDGDCFWHCDATGVSSYELPVGSHTLCGWRALRDGGGWVHTSGAKIDTPPFLNEKEAEVHILTHLKVRVRDAWAQPFG